MITKSSLVIVAILLFASPAFSQFGQANNRLNDLAARLSREAEEFANQTYNNYANSSRNNRNDIEVMMAAQQFGASAQIFYRMVSDRRRNAELRDAFDLLSNLARTAERNNLQRNTWFNIQRLMTDISRELNIDSGGGGQFPDTGSRTGRMTWRGRVDDDVRIRIRGGTAEVETIGGTPYSDSQPNFMNSLPYRRVTVRLTSRRGRGEIFIDQRASFSPATIPSKTQKDSSPLPDWAHYPAGVMWALLEAKLSTQAMNAVYASNVPRGSGLSSSASVEMAFMIAWQTLGKWILPAMQCALLGQKAENQYVGVNCGIMDQFASACGVENNLLLLDCRSLEWKTIPLPSDVAIVIADTMVRRKLTSGEYNKRRAACEEAVRLLQKDLPHIKSLRDVSVEDFNRFVGKLPEEVSKRARHVVEEIERTSQAESLLEAGNIQHFGKLMNECHASLRDLYEVSCPELDVMVRIAQSLDGCYGARLTGAGFGGCTVNLVALEKAKKFAQTLAEGYQSEAGYQPEIYITRASRGAELLV